MAEVLSLRGRLTAIILVPLLIVAAGVGFWQLENARRTATDVFDKSLLAAALAVANDVAISGGDALSPRTRDILSDTSGGEVFYHVYAPDGVIVAGYATPPVGIPRADDEAASGPIYFDAIYLGRSVHGVRLQNRAEIEGFAGVFTTTVWQDTAVRAAFVRDLVLRALLATTGLIASVALIVWFGVRRGLRPLTDLEAAIASRSSAELNPIQRAVPVEVGGIVATLNRLFGQVTRSMNAQSEFISNAAHQLRNPIAGVLSLAEAVEAAPTPEAARERAGDLLTAARETADLSQKLLLLERAKTISPHSTMDHIHLDARFAEWAEAFRTSDEGGPEITTEIKGTLGYMSGDATMIREALLNLVDNARRHGGPDLTRIHVQAQRQGSDITFRVTDDGVGLTPDQIAAARKRFSTVSATSASGLGVSIVEAVARGHGGQFTLAAANPGLRAEMRLAAYR